MSDSDRQLKPETRAAQALGRLDDATGAIVPPLHSSTTFARDANYRPVGSHIYSREGSPTVDLAEEVIASLDEGEGARLFASGLAATAALVQTVPLGGRVVAPRVMYHGAQDWFRRLAAEGRVKLDLFDETDPSALAATVGRAPVDLVWIETPVNPTWNVIDIAAAARTTHAAGALLAVDSTCAPPPTTKPLLLGADFVFHSATKYLNGHSDLTAGALVTRDAGGERWRDVARVRTLSGGTLGAFEAWLLLRGLRTLYVRFGRQCETAMTLARRLEAHPRVERVLYPGLEIASRACHCRSPDDGGLRRHDVHSRRR